MNARSTRGPGGGRHGGRRPPVRRTTGRDTSKPGCAMVAAAALALVSTAVILTPLAARVWTTAMVPAANRIHYGDALTPALALAGLALYLLVSVLFVHRRTYVLVAARGEQRSEDPAAGVVPPQVTPPPPPLVSRAAMAAAGTHFTPAAREH